jgi:Mycobacterial 2 TMS Phage Holin (M2 Hol) Family
MSAKIRLTLYVVSTIVSGIVTILVSWKLLDPGTASTVNDLIRSLAGLLGTGASATAAVVLSQQTKNGTVGSSAADQAINGLQATVQQASIAVTDLDRVRQAATDALSAVLPGSLAQQVIDLAKRL